MKRVERLEQAAAYVAEELRRQAAPGEWGTQEAVSAWLLILADHLTEAITQEEEKK